MTDPLSPKVHVPKQPLIVNENLSSADEASEQGENGIGFQRRNARRGMYFKPRDETEPKGMQEKESNLLSMLSILTACGS